MKRLWLLLAIVATFVQIALASPPTAGREIVKTDDGYVVKYTLPDIKVSENVLYPQEKVCSLDGFNMNTTPGEPAYAFINDTFIIPKGYAASVELVSGEYKEIAGDLSEASTAYESNTESRIGIKQSPGFYPANIAEITSLNKYRGIELCQIQMTPVQYDSENHQIRLYTTLSYKLTFIQQEQHGAGDAFQPYISPDDPFLKNIALNFADSQTRNGMLRSTPMTEPGAPVSYLVITTDALKGAADKFAEWKRTLGLKTYVVSQNSWTSAQVKAAIEDFYENYASLYYLLILGSSSQVPAMTYETDDYFCQSDLPYAQISDSLLPDFYRGRISVTNLADATAVIDKIIDYERNPVTDPSFYKTASVIGTFIENTDLEKFSEGTENRRFVYTCEDVRNVLAANNIEAKRLYSKFSYISDDFTPSYWHPCTNLENDTAKRIPVDLTEASGFKWDADVTKVIDHFNKGQLLCVYNGHGTAKSWSPINVYASDFGKTTNGKKLPLVISISCKGGTLSNGHTSIAENLMSNPNGGAIGVFGATANSVEDVNEVFLLGAVNAIFPTSNIKQKFPFSYQQTPTPTPIYRLGQIMDQGLYRMRESFKNKFVMSSSGITFYNPRSLYIYHLYHCFGDPSMRLYTKVPGTFENVTYSTARDVQIGNQVYYRINVNVPGASDNTIISCYDKSVDRMTYGHGSEASFNMIADFDDIVISVTEHNMKPYILYPKHQGGWFGMKKGRATPKDDYRPIIEENKIWEYYLEHKRCPMDPIDNKSFAKIIRMQFKGTTEINGKEYHNLVMTYGYHTTIAPLHEFDNYDPSKDVEYKFLGEEVIAYMREDGPRCYALLHRGDSEDSEMAWKLLGRMVGSEENEYMVYDFSLLTGGIINHFAGFDEEAIEAEKGHMVGYFWDDLGYYSWWNFEWWENFIERMYAVSDEYGGQVIQRTYRGEFVEGIGSKTCYLPFPGSYEEASLNNVYDLEGNIIYYGLGKHIDLDNPKATSAGITETDNGVSDIYSIDGRLVKRNAESTEGLPQGIYIFRGKKVIVR